MKNKVEFQKALKQFCKDIGVPKELIIALKELITLQKERKININGSLRIKKLTLSEVLILI